MLARVSHDKTALGVNKTHLSSSGLFFPSISILVLSPESRTDQVTTGLLACSSKNSSTNNLGGKVPQNPKLKAFLVIPKLYKHSSEILKRTLIFFINSLAKNSQALSRVRCATDVDGLVEGVDGLVEGVDGLVEGVDGLVNHVDGLVDKNTYLCKIQTVQAPGRNVLMMRGCMQVLGKCVGSASTCRCWYDMQVLDGHWSVGRTCRCHVNI